MTSSSGSSRTSSKDCGVFVGKCMIHGIKKIKRWIRDKGGKSHDVFRYVKDFRWGSATCRGPAATTTSYLSSDDASQTGTDLLRRMQVEPTYHQIREKLQTSIDVSRIQGRGSRAVPSPEDNSDVQVDMSTPSSRQPTPASTTTSATARITLPVCTAA